MRSMACELICFCCLHVWAAEVKWNCFTLHDGWEENCVGCWYYDMRVSPEIGLRYSYGKNGKVQIDGKGDSNVGWNVALWITATLGDVLDRDYFSQPHVVLKNDYNAYSPNPIETDSTGDTISLKKNKSVYLALIGDCSQDGQQPSDYFGWVELMNTGTELEVVSSAFSYGSLYVGGGAVPVPEPTTALLALLGGVGMFLRRKRRAHRARPTSRGV